MKKLLLTLSLFLATFSFAIAQVNIPDKINLKEAWKVEGKQKPVIFDHKLHSDMNPCTDCHSSDAGGSITLPGDIKGTNDKNAAHKNCWDCHTINNVKVGKTCTKCHNG